MTAPSGARGDLAGSAQRGDGDDDEPALRAMRAVWLAMRDEDPPDRGMAELLAAARGAAETMRGRPTLWQRLVAGLRRPPALALATVMVLVGGEVILGRRGVDVPAPAAPSGVPGLVVAPPAPQTESGPDLRKAEAVAEPDGSADEPRSTATATDGRPSRPLPAATREPAGPSDDLEGAAGVANEPPPPPIFEAEATKKADRSEATGAGHDKQQAAPAVPLEQLYKQCASAARRGDCAAVRLMVGRIKKSDRSYRTRVAKDAAVAKCLAE